MGTRAGSGDVTKNPNTPKVYSNGAARIPPAGSATTTYNDSTHAGKWDCFIDIFANARATSVPSVQQPYTHGRIIIAPNPSHNRFTVTFNNESNNSIMPMVVINALGQVLLNRDINVTRGENKFMLDLDQLPAGMYLLQIAGSEGIRMIKY